jgi:signal transduction protein with GAF and PtsI domain
MDPGPHTLQSQFDRLTLLYQISQTIHSTLEPDAALKLIVTEAVRAVRATSGSIALINPNTGLLEIQSSIGLPPEAIHVKLRVSEGVTGMVARTGQPLRVGDTASSPVYVSVRPDVRSELAVPLDVSGETRGVLNVDSNDLDAFTESDQEMLQELALRAVPAQSPAV